MDKYTIYFFNRIERIQPFASLERLIADDNKLNDDSVFFWPCPDSASNSVVANSNIYSNKINIK